MGSLIGGVFNAFGSHSADSQLAASGQAASQAALTGYRYATGPGSIYYRPYQANGVNALDNQNSLLDAKTALLTSDQSNNPAYQNYLNSTGFNFQFNKGVDAVNSNAASKGLLNSGGTAKALTEYGQGIAGQYFGNYLNQLGGLADQRGNQAGMGLNATNAITQSGSQGGAAAANALTQTGIQQAGAQQSMWSSIGSGIGGLFNMFA